MGKGSVCNPVVSIELLRVTWPKPVNWFQIVSIAFDMTFIFDTYGGNLTIQNTVVCFVLFLKLSPFALHTDILTDRHTKPTAFRMYNIVIILISIFITFIILNIIIRINDNNCIDNNNSLSTVCSRFILLLKRVHCLGRI